MEAEAEIHRHCAERLRKKGKGDCTSQGVKMGQPIETADLSSQELMDAGPTVREPASYLPRPSAFV